MKTKFFPLTSITILVALLLGLFVSSPASVFASRMLDTLINHNLLQSGQGLTSLGGCTGIAATRIELYCNGDGVYKTNTGFTTLPGQYRIDLNGSSNGSNAAGADIYIDSVNGSGGSKLATFTWNSSSASTQSILFNVTSGANHEIKFTISTDNGSSDTYLYYYDLYYVGPAPTQQPAPNPPSVGAYTSGVYRNLLAERGYSSTAISNKINAAWSQLFYGTDGTGNRYDGQRIYYPDGSNANGNKAYMADIASGDVRSEGMSYGMMIAVQLNHQAEFNALWNWVKTNMQHTSGDYAGYTCWHNNFSGGCLDQNPATDGEEWFAIALYMASGRWGNGSGIYNYRAEADYIENAMLNHAYVNSVTPMFDASNNEPVFVPYANAATYTDPSYHLPAFYHLFSVWGPGADSARWLTIRDRSRTFFGQTTNATTGLMPDYATFSGAPTGSQQNFAFDAWRTASNWAVDYSWFAADANEKTYSNRIQAFFESKGIGSYANQWSVSGSQLSSDHSPGHVAMNAAAGLAATDARAWLFIDELWNLPIPSGQYRYYDGMLYFLGLLETSGNFRIYAPGGSPSPTNTPPAPTATATRTNTPAATPTRTSTPTRTNTPAGPTATFTRTNTPAGPTNTPTRTNTPLGPTDTPSPTNTSGGSGNPYNQVEAETFTSQSGATTQAGDGGTVVNLSTSSSYIAFANMDFGAGGAGSVQIRNWEAGAGVNLQIRLDSPTGSILCTVYGSGNGNWATNSNTCYPKPAGVHTLYITSSSSNTQFNWFKFLP